MTDQAERSTVTTWLGKPVSDLTREELIEALNYMGNAHRRAIEDHQATLRIWRAYRGAA
jgi:hypothetical protein